MQCLRGETHSHTSLSNIIKQQGRGGGVGLRACSIVKKRIVKYYAINEFSINSFAQLYKPVNFSLIPAFNYGEYNQKSSGCKAAEGEHAGERSHCTSGVHLHLPYTSGILQ